MKKTISAFLSDKYTELRNADLARNLEPDHDDLQRRAIHQVLGGRFNKIKDDQDPLETITRWHLREVHDGRKAELAKIKAWLKRNQNWIVTTSGTPTEFYRGKIVNK
jgi:hypothetical protein